VSDVTPDAWEVRIAWQEYAFKVDGSHNDEFDRWLQGVINTAYNEGYEAAQSTAHSLTPDDAYRAFCEARKGSALVPGEYEAMFSRVEYAWLATAIKGGSHS
jgi:hypothetical protein